LFFILLNWPDLPSDPPMSAASSQAGDLPSAGFTGCMPAFTSA